MSLILEALKKSEAERRAGELPVVLSERAYVPHRERPIWPVFAAFVVLVGLAGAYVNRSLLWPERFPVVAEEAPTAAPAGLPDGSLALNEAHTPAETTIEPTPSEIPTPPTPPNSPIRSAQPSNPVPTTHDPVAPPPTLAGPELTEAAPEAPPDVADASDPPPSFPTPVMTPEQLSPPPEPEPEPESEPASALPVPEIAAALPGPTQAPAEAMPSDSVPDFQNLPFATRQAMPALKVSMFVFHQDPNRRFIIVNGARLQEGGVVGEETWLREIRQDGAVFEFRGERFLLRRQGG